MTFVSPFPYFGGKSKVAPEIWLALGNTPNYVEPFFGSGAALLGRPNAHAVNGKWPTETVNDKDGMVSNFWRALQSDAQAVARYADWPANENDLHARHWWLVNRLPDLTRLLEGDASYFDVKAAGWWVWGMACWIGHGFCSGRGPWQSVDGRLLPVGRSTGGIRRKLLHVGDQGQGIKRQLLHVGSAGRGIQRKLLHVGDQGRGVNRKHTDIYAYFDALAERLQRVRVCSGDWTRVCGPSVTTKHGLTGVFLDPPYRQQGRDLVYNHEHMDIADEVMTWAIAQGNDPLMRIVYAGYADGRMEHEFAAAGWQAHAWKASSGFGGQRRAGVNDNKHRERLWYSPHCIPLERKPTTADMFYAQEAAS